jgi:uncharacterized membrane protein
MLKLYGTTAVTFLAIDLVWIGVVADGFYQRHIGHLLDGGVRWRAAILFYLIYVAGLLVFAVLPAIEAQSLSKALMLGGFLGLFAYATFDLTCMALFRDFPGIVVGVDMIWGTVLSASVTAIVYGLRGWLGLGA